ncbi:MAG: DUF1707 SHOCT-like domain-containing protein [Acidimicrobiales bacterium]
MCWSNHDRVHRAWNRPEPEAANPVTTPGDLRVSDAERDAVVAELRRHVGDGRLGLDEFESRVEEAMAARTGAELRAVLRELPPLATRTSRTGSPRRSARGTGPRLSEPIGALFVLLGVLVAVSAVVGHLILWPLIPLAFWWFGGCGRHHRDRQATEDRDDAMTLV